MEELKNYEIKLSIKAEDRNELQSLIRMIKKAVNVKIKSTKEV